MTNVSDGPGGGGRGDRPVRLDLSGSWTIEQVRGGAGVLHDRGVPARPTRAVSALAVDRPALVLGSTQAEADVDAAACAAAGVAIVRRRSGGGAVLLEPGRVVWVDVVVPAGDRLWDADVGRAFLWLGWAWAAALESCGVEGPRVHEGPLRGGRWGSKVCFAGLGPGEVVDGRGRKVVGLAQRRTRAGSLFQCAVPLAWDARSMVELLAWPDAGERAEAELELAASVSPVQSPATTIVDALVSSLPA